MVSEVRQQWQQQFCSDVRSPKRCLSYGEMLVSQSVGSHRRGSDDLSGKPHSVSLILSRPMCANNCVCNSDVRDARRSTCDVQYDRDHLNVLLIKSSQQVTTRVSTIYSGINCHSNELIVAQNYQKNQFQPSSNTSTAMKNLISPS